MPLINTVPIIHNHSDYITEDKLDTIIQGIKGQRVFITVPQCTGTTTTTQSFDIPIDFTADYILCTWGAVNYSGGWDNYYIGCQPIPAATDVRLYAGESYTSTQSESWHGEVEISPYSMTVKYEGNNKINITTTIGQWLDNFTKYEFELTVICYI